MVTLEDLLRTMAANRGSDLHITAGSAPRIRISGQLRPMDLPPLTPDESQKLIYAILNAEQIARFERERNWTPLLDCRASGVSA